MVTYVYRPNHPDADEFGHVEKSLALEWDYLHEKDNRAMIGNKVVTMNFISDTQPLTRHMCDGKYYDSKKQYRDTTKAHGCIEVGNNVEGLKRKPVELSRRDRREAIKKSIYELKNKPST